MQISFDINKLIETSEDSNKKLRQMAKKTNINLKTLQRICRSENKPNYMTVFKIYRYLLNVSDDNDVLRQSPEVIKNFLLSTNPSALNKSKTYKDDVDQKISSNPIFAEIYALSSIGKINSQNIKNRFGEYGIDLVKEMCRDHILKYLGDGDVILGDRQTNLSAESLLTLGNQFTKNYAKPENAGTLGNNHIAFTAEGLSEQGYQKWLQIDDNSYKLKIELLKQSSSLGRIKVFSYTVTDTIKKSGNES